MIRNDMTIPEAVKVDTLCCRVLGDIGSIHARITPQTEDGTTTAPMPPDLVALRRYVREVQDAVREQYPRAFFK